ncbi:phage major tail tube protein [Campylobacter sp. RM9334]|uniref:phage major tail tube protein n=1 Tax=Campylobacter sp. RM9334 TaxID=2735732 RepID=UPI001D880B43|nr:phage major tail tube protein [Campylobacter sp. RM9334]
MKRKIPDIISDLNVFVGGREFLGVCPNFKIPDITQVMVEHNGALKGKVGSGIYEALEITFKLNELDFGVYTDFAANNNKTHIPLAMRESIHKQGTGDLPLAVELLGEFESLAINEDSVGATREITLKLYADVFTLRQNGKPIIVYDRLNSVFVIGGVDMMSEIRKNLEL